MVLTSNVMKLTVPFAAKAEKSSIMDTTESHAFIVTTIYATVVFIEEFTFYPNTSKIMKSQLQLKTFVT